MVVALLVWHAAEALLISPDFLAYFNRLAGGPDEGYRHLVDSSLDWGQDLPGLKAWLDREGLQGRDHPVVYLSYFGSARPDHYGIEAATLPGFPERWTPRFPPPLTGGVYCISATMLQAVYVLEAPGEWTPAYEKRYQDALYNLRLFDSTGADPSARAALLRQTGEAMWVRMFRVFEQLRFARLAAFLRAREPDANVGHSILIYRLSDDDVEAAVAGPAPYGLRSGQARTSVDPVRAPNDVQRPPLDLLIDAADVFPENADADQLHAAEEQHAHDRRREARDRLVHREEGDEVEHSEDERDK